MTTTKPLHELDAAERRARAVELLNTLAEHEKDPGAKGYAQGMAERIARTGEEVRVGYLVTLLVAIAHHEDTEHAATLDRLVASGAVDLSCAACVPAVEQVLATGERPFGPRHRASQRCQSGRRDHCTCDTCF